MTTPTDIPALARAKAYVAWCEGVGPSTPSLSPREVRDLAAALEKAICERCTSPWPDSPPCRGIARERERAERAELMLKDVANACERAERGWKQEADDADAVLVTLALDPDVYRTEGGSLNTQKIRTAIGERQADMIRKVIALTERAERAEAQLNALSHRHERALIEGAKRREERDAALALLRQIRPYLVEIRMPITTDKLQAAIDAMLAKGDKA